MSRFRMTLPSSVEDFWRARRKADLEIILARLAGRQADLLSFEEVRRRLNARPQSGRELKDIPIDAIVGSVGRYNDFTRSFLPRQDSDRVRWTRVEAAVTETGGLAPIEVYQIDQVYFVLDGHHRVSVARQMGASRIEAWVVPLQTRVPLTPDVEPDDLIVKAEYADFLHRTRLDEIRPEVDLTVTVPGQYRVLDEHIAVHRHFMGLEQQREIPCDEALAHWVDYVYLPVVDLICERGLLREFPGRTETDLYLWLAEHRAALERELGWQVRPDSAALDLAERAGSGRRGVLARLIAWLHGALVPDELEAGPPAGAWRREHLARREERLFALILVALNGRQSGWNALDQALVVAHREGAQLRGLHIVPTEEERESETVDALRAEFERRCRAAGVDGALAVEVGTVPQAICARSRWNDLIVLSLSYPPPPQSVARLGSGLSAIIRRCPRPILMVPETGASALERLLLAYDGSPKAEEAMFVAAYMARCWQVPLVVVTVAEDGGRAPSDAPARAQEYLAAHRVRATLVQESGAVAQAVLRVARAQDSQLIVMGGYGYSPVVEAVLGSAVDEVLRTSHRPMLICR